MKELIGVGEIARMLGVVPETASQKRSRHFGLMRMVGGRLTART